MPNNNATKIAMNKKVLTVLPKNLGKVNQVTFFNSENKLLNHAPSLLKKPSFFFPCSALEGVFFPFAFGALLFVSSTLTAATSV